MPKEETPGQIIFKRFRRHKLAMISMVVISLIFLSSLFVRYIAPFKADDLQVGNYFLLIILNHFDFYFSLFNPNLTNL